MAQVQLACWGNPEVFEIVHSNSCFGDRTSFMRSTLVGSFFATVFVVTYYKRAVIGDQESDKKRFMRNKVITAPHSPFPIEKGHHENKQNLDLVPLLRSLTGM